MIKKISDELLPSSLKESKLAFHGVRFDVRTVQIEGKNQNKVQRDVVIHPGAVIILPFLDEKTIIMIRNERFAVGETLWELPAGTLEASEKPEETAKRELIEETGFEAKQIDPLLSFYTTPGICNEVMHAYVAKNLKEVGQKLEESEKIIVEKVSWDQALKMIRDGLICDGKTIATLLFYDSFGHRK